MRNPWIVIGVLAVLLFGGAIWYGSTVSQAANEGVVIKPHIKGNLEAPVVLVEYSDFQCPACAQFQPIISELLAEYGDRMSFEYRHFPLLQIHPLAEPAARAAEAAGQQGKFYEFHDLLFQNQATWSRSSNPGQFFTEYATTLGLDLEAFARHQRSSLIRDHVRSQFNEARELGFTGTPSFTLNGQQMNFTSFDDFRAQIRQAIDPALVMPTTSATGSEAVTVPAGEPAVRFGL